MPVYTYQREDGSTFEIRQKFSDNPLTVDPETGQSVKRVIQAAGIVFKGSGFYVNDSKKASKSSLSGSSSTTGSTDKPADTTTASTSTDSAPKQTSEPAAD